MTITVEELEAAGYVIHKQGYLSKDGKKANMYDLNGYMNVEVFLPRQKGKAKPWTYVRLHRIIAMKYVPNPNNYTHVGFKRGGSHRWSNLYWIPSREAAKTSKAKLRREGIILLEMGEIDWNTAWKKYGVTRSTAYKLWREVNA